MTIPTNGYAQGNNVSVGSNVTLGCDPGYTNLGQGCGTYPVQSQCQYDGTHVFWSIDSLQCVQGIQLLLHTL
mgnify:CR=1 FL=1